MNSPKREWADQRHTFYPDLDLVKTSRLRPRAYSTLGRCARNRPAVLATALRFACARASGVALRVGYTSHAQQVVAATARITGSEERVGEAVYATPHPARRWGHAGGGDHDGRQVVGGGCVTARDWSDRG